MNKLVISGYYGFGNAGDEAMLSAMVGALRAIDSQIQITVISGNPDDTRKQYGVLAVHRLNLWGIACAIFKSDLLISGGGSLLQDVTSGRSIFYYLGIMQIACLFGRPIMLYAQGIGPIRSKVARAFMKHVGNCIAGGTVRDEGSLTELAGLGVIRPKVTVTADPVLALELTSTEAGREILDNLGLSGEGPLIGFSVREWQGRDHYKTVFAAVADRLVVETGARIVFIPMQWPDDVQAARLVAARMKQPHGVIGKKCDTSELLSVVRNLDLLVGVRLHALIFAAVMERPFVGVSYDPKIDRFLETLGERHAGTLDAISIDGLMERILLTQNDTSAVVRRRQRVEELRAQALRNARCAMDLLTKKRERVSPVERKQS
ncbi:MAG TPA: polysaccharide pyruvyl transferase CsaB [Negativicutes bacterium]|nr:polysaccharide pyruvyl transferase CsaB [Negativicutes bacterium]